MTENLRIMNNRMVLLNPLVGLLKNNRASPPPPAQAPGTAGRTNPLNSAGGMSLGGIGSGGGQGIGKLATHPP